MKIKAIKTSDYSDRKLARVRLFIHNNKQSVLDGLWSRHDGSVSKGYRKEVLPEIVAKRHELKGVKFSWSNACGCACGCSPGFIAHIHPDKAGYEALWVTI